MKTSVLICGRREPGLPAFITGELYYRGILPDAFHSETMGSGTVRIRVEMECDAQVLDRLLAYWKSLHGVQSIVATPLGEDEPTATAID
jgi:hypothetical protein